MSQAIPYPVDVGGHAYDATGGALAGVLLDYSVAGGRSATRTVVDGGFILKGYVGGGSALDVSSPNMVLVRRSHVTDPNQAADHILVFAPALQLAGTVSGPLGSAISGAQLRVSVPLAAFAAHRYDIERTELARWEAASAADGGFALVAPGGLNAAIAVAAAGFESRDFALPATSVSNWNLQLSRPPIGLEGVVRLSDGKPASGATVRLGAAACKTKSDGAFELYVAQSGSSRLALVATMPGLQPAIIPEFVPEAHMGKRVYLQLGAAALTLEGVVVTGSGDPCVGWSILLLDAAELVPGRVPSESAESLAGDGDSVIRTGEMGKFEVRGLADRSYRLLVWNERTLASVRTEPLRAGSRELRIEVADGLRRVSGYIHTSDGLPLANARVRLTLPIGAGGGSTACLTGTTVHSAPDGAFALSDVPWGDAFLRIDGGTAGLDIVLQEVVIPAMEAPPSMSIDVVRNCQFRFASAQPEEGRPDRLAAVDKKGNRLLLHRREYQRSTAVTELVLEHGMSGLVTVAESAVEILSIKSGQVVTRIPCRLAPGTVLELSDRKQ